MLEIINVFKDENLCHFQNTKRPKNLLLNKNTFSKKKSNKQSFEKDLKIWIILSTIFVFIHNKKWYTTLIQE